MSQETNQELLTPTCEISIKDNHSADRSQEIKEVFNQK